MWVVMKECQSGVTHELATNCMFTAIFDSLLFLQVTNKLLFVSTKFRLIACSVVTIPKL